AERRMYLPLIALVTLAVIVVAWLWRTITVRRVNPAKAGSHDPKAGSHDVAVAGHVPVAGLFAAAVVIVLAVTTVARNREYHSAVTLAQTVVERRPTPIAHHILGVQLMEAGQHQEAEAELRQATAGDSQARYDLGVELFNENKLDDALTEFQAFVATWR